jgi:hypothetical protein
MDEESMSPFYVGLGSHGLPSASVVSEGFFF